MKFALVVPNLNYARFLGECLHSIERQRDVAVDVLVVDGGSNDGSIEIANAFSERNGWRTEVKPGLNQAASIQYGIDQLVGSEEVICCWLNSDDCYLSDQALKRVHDIFEHYFSVDLVSLGGMYIDENGRNIKPIVYDYHPLIRGDIFRRGGGFVQPSTFWLSRVMGSVRIDDSFRYVFDGEFFLRCKKSAFNLHLDQREYISGYRLHGSNLSLNVPPQRVSELSLVYSQILDRPVAAGYLRFSSSLLKILERIPFIGHKAKRAFYFVNNGLSYLSRYLIPSI